MTNEEILELGITPNQYFLADCIYTSNKQAVDKFFSIESEDKIKNDLYKLYTKGYIECDLCDVYTFDFNKMKISKLFDERKKQEDIEEQQLEEFARKLYELFPDKIESGNIPVRSGFKDFKNKLKKYKKNNKEHPDEVILEATKRYIHTCSKDNYRYIKTAGYFIYKFSESVLQGCCEEYLSNPDRKISENSGSNMEVG